MLGNIPCCGRVVAFTIGVLTVAGKDGGGGGLGGHVFTLDYHCALLYWVIMLLIFL